MCVNKTDDNIYIFTDGLELRCNGKEEFFVMDGVKLENVRFSVYNNHTKRLILKDSKLYGGLIRDLVLRFEKHDFTDGKGCFIRMDYGNDNPECKYISYIWCDSDSDIMYVLDDNEEFSKTMFSIDLIRRKFFSLIDTNLEGYISGMLPKKRVTSEKRLELKESISFFESVYGISYNKTGYLSVMEELDIMKEVTYSFKVLDDFFGLHNYPKLNKLLVTMSKTSYGKYNESDYIIELSRYGDKVGMRSTIYHEYGHHIFFHYWRKGSEYRDCIKSFRKKLNEMDSLSYISNKAQSRMINAGGKVSRNLNRYYSNYEKYLLENTEIFARLVECLLSGVYKVSEDDLWSFNESEVELFCGLLDDLSSI